MSNSTWTSWHWLRLCTVLLWLLSCTFIFCLWLISSVRIDYFCKRKLVTDITIGVYWCLLNFLVFSFRIASCPGFQEGGGERDPGTDSSRMRLIYQHYGNFVYHWRYSPYTDDVMSIAEYIANHTTNRTRVRLSTQPFDHASVQTGYLGSRGDPWVSAWKYYHWVDFEEALSFALCLLENKDFTLKGQQRETEARVGWQGRVRTPTNWLWQI